MGRKAYQLNLGTADTEAKETVPEIKRKFRYKGSQLIICDCGYFEK